MLRAYKPVLSTQGVRNMDFGIPQNRKRIFVVSIYGENDFDFETLKKVETRSIDDFLEKGVSDLYEVRQESMLRYLVEIITKVI